MHIEINGNQESIKSCTVEAMLDELKTGKEGIAVAVNEAVVPKSMWPTFDLNENDKIMIITATAGG